MDSEVAVGGVRFPVPQLTPEEEGTLEEVLESVVAEYLESHEEKKFNALLKKWSAGNWGSRNNVYSVLPHKTRGLLRGDLKEVFQNQPLRFLDFLGESHWEDLLSWTPEDLTYLFNGYVKYMLELIFIPQESWRDRDSDWWKMWAFRLISYRATRAWRESFFWKMAESYRRPENLDYEIILLAGHARGLKIYDLELAKRALQEPSS